jgi:hypothetical protein
LDYLTLPGEEIYTVNKTNVKQNLSHWASLSWRSVTGLPFHGACTLEILLTQLLFSFSTHEKLPISLCSSMIAIVPSFSKPQSQSIFLVVFIYSNQTFFCARVLIFSSLTYNKIIFFIDFLRHKLHAAESRGDSFVYQMEFSKLSFQSCLFTVNHSSLETFFSLRTIVFIFKFPKY